VASSSPRGQRQDSIIADRDLSGVGVFQKLKFNEAPFLLSAALNRSSSRAADLDTEHFQNETSAARYHYRNARCNDCVISTYGTTPVRNTESAPRSFPARYRTIPRLLVAFMIPRPHFSRWRATNAVDVPSILPRASFSRLSRESGCTLCVHFLARVLIVRSYVSCFFY